LEELGAWANIAEAHPLGSAQVLNGGSPLALTFEPGQARGPLGQLVSNHLIRRALFEAIDGQAGVTLLADASVARAAAGPQGCAV
ncbi:hypothetical protein O6221_23625, partial [Salmonella enterica subsp. enterica]